MLNVGKGEEEWYSISVYDHNEQLLTAANVGFSTVSVDYFNPFVTLLQCQTLCVTAVMFYSGIYIAICTCIHLYIMEVKTVFPSDRMHGMALLFM